MRQWLSRHIRFTFQFTSTYCSWLNAVKGLFAKLSKRSLKRGVFRPVAEHQAAINWLLEEHSHASKPFTWIADQDKIITAVKRGIKCWIQATNTGVVERSEEVYAPQPNSLSQWGKFFEDDYSIRWAL